MEYVGVNVVTGEGNLVCGISFGLGTSGLKAKPVSKMT